MKKEMIKSRQLSFMAVCDIGNSLVAIDEWGRGIFQIDKKDMSTRFLAMLKKGKHQRNLYQCAEYLDKEIFFIPYSLVNEEVVIYHMENRQIEYLELGKISSLVQGDYKPTYRTENSIWMFPTDFSRDIIIFHMDTRKIETIPLWKKFMQDIKLDYTGTYRKIGTPVETQNVLYYPVKRTNCIVELDKSSYKMKRHLLPTDVKLHPAMDYDGQKFWIPEINSERIIAWNLKTGNVNYYPILLPSDELQKSEISRVLCGARYLWIILGSGNRLARLDYETGNYEFIDIFPQEFYCQTARAGELFYTIIKNENVADIYPFLANMVIHLDLENDILVDRYEQIFLPEEWSEQDILDYQLQNDNEYESERVSADVYMNSFFQTIKDTAKKNQTCNSGENIWRQVSGE